ncbi:MAG: DUF177 domain-containing protein [Dehalococcoidia bacterium]
MIINVSTLLGEPLGSSRDYHSVCEQVSVLEPAFERTVSGDVHLIRTPRGVLVSARLDYEVDALCARCARPFTLPVTVAFDEEYVHREDPHATARGRIVDADDFVVDEHRHLDLSEAVRQYEPSALPLVPLCRPDCRGLCPVCGSDLNEADCACRTGPIDERWGALGTLAERLRTREDANGGSEA